MSNILVIFSSARSDGHTMEAVERLTCDQDVELINLLDKQIAPFDYEHQNTEDDFLDIATKMTEAEIIIFATPIYWYSMCGLLKHFFDRFTDLVTVRKDLGRRLKGKQCYIVCSGAEHTLPKSFTAPFIATCRYLEMEYQDCLYYYSGENTDIIAKRDTELETFQTTLFTL